MKSAMPFKIILALLIESGSPCDFPEKKNMCIMVHFGSYGSKKTMEKNKTTLTGIRTGYLRLPKLLLFQMLVNFPRTQNFQLIFQFCSHDIGSISYVNIVSIVT